MTGNDTNRLPRLFWLTIALAHQQIKERHAGTVGGTIWLVAHPLSLLAVLWFVFSVGFRVPPQGDVPFVLVIFAALVPWMLFSEALSSTVGSISAKAYLVRKIAFPMEILPIVPIVAALVPHAILLVILSGLSIFMGAFTGWQALMIFPYLIGLLLFAYGLGLALSSMSVFYKDLPQIVTVVLNIWFWWTPIVWSVDMVPAHFRWIVDANPMVWVVNGYRAALLGIGPATPGPISTLRFVVIVGLSVAIGSFVFRRLRPHFADVL